MAEGVSTVFRGSCLRGLEGPRSERKCCREPSTPTLGTTLPPVTTAQSPTFVQAPLPLPFEASPCNSLLIPNHSCVYKPQESKNSTLHSSAYGRLLGMLSDKVLITNRKLLLNTFPFWGITSKQDIDVKLFAEIPSL